MLKLKRVVIHEFPPNYRKINHYSTIIFDIPCTFFIAISYHCEKRTFHS